MLHAICARFSPHPFPLKTNAICLWQSKVKAAGVPEPGDAAFVSAKAGRTGRPGYAANFAEITLKRRKW